MYAKFKTTSLQNQTVTTKPVAGTSELKQDSTLMVTNTAETIIRSPSCSKESTVKETCSAVDIMSDHVRRAISKIEQSVSPKLTSNDKQLLADLRFYSERLIAFSKDMQCENQELKAKIHELEKQVAALQEKENYMEAKLDKTAKELNAIKEDNDVMQADMASLKETMRKMETMMTAMFYDELPPPYIMDFSRPGSSQLSDCYNLFDQTKQDIDIDLCSILDDS